MPLMIVRRETTEVRAEAIVNIVAPSGEALKEAQAVVTSEENLPCRHIINIAEPVLPCDENERKELLANRYVLCLEKADELQCETLALPLLCRNADVSSETDALGIAFETIENYLENSDLTVYLCTSNCSSLRLPNVLFDAVADYIADNLVVEVKSERKMCRCLAPEEIPPCKKASAPSGAKKRKMEIEACEASVMPPEFLERIKNRDKSFSEMLFMLIDEKGMSDVACYKKANVSRKTFSKIKCDANYRPSKETAIAFAIALELDEDETDALLKTVGITLSNSLLFDIIIAFFISERIYDIFVINEVLFEYDQPCLGC